MGKLIVLEWKKNRAGRYGLAVAILTAALALFLFAQVYLGIANDPVTGVPDAAPGTFNISSQVELVSNVTFWFSPALCWRAASHRRSGAKQCW